MLAIMMKECKCSPWYGEFFYIIWLCYDLGYIKCSIYVIFLTYAKRVRVIYLRTPEILYVVIYRWRSSSSYSVKPSQIWDLETKFSEETWSLYFKHGKASFIMDKRSYPEICSSLYILNQTFSMCSPPRLCGWVSHIRYAKRDCFSNRNPISLLHLSHDRISIRL